MNAVKVGKMGAMVYAFPSDLCSHSGRTINNNAPNWPRPLQEKAKQLYDRYEERMKPQANRLRADGRQLPQRGSGGHRLLSELGATRGVT